MAKLMRTVFLIGLAVTWHPDAAVGQYSWSNFSVSAGFGTGGVGFGVGATYAAVDPLYDFYYADPCLDYAYYESYRHACSRGYDGIHLRQSYSVVSVNHYRHSRRPSYYRPYGYYGYPSHTHFSVSFGFGFGYGYPSPYYGSLHYTPIYSAYRYPTYGYGYSAYGYGYSAYGYGYSAYGYGYSAYGVVRYGGSRRASAVIRPAPVYRGSPLVRSSPVYKESPQPGVQRTLAARSITPGTTAATPSASGRGARPSSPLRSVGEQPRRARALLNTGGTDGLRARRGTPTRLYPPSRATTSRRPSPSSSRASTQRSAPTPSVGSERPSRALALGRSGTPTPSRAAPRPTDRSRPGAVTRSTSMRERTPATRAAPSARTRTSGPAQARTASPQRSRATQPSARPAPARTPPRAQAIRRTPVTRSAAPRSAAPRATAPRATTSRAATPRSRASSRGVSRGAGRARATMPARSRSTRR